MHGRTGEDLVELSLAADTGAGTAPCALRWTGAGWSLTRLRRALASLPLPKAADGRVVPAVDVSYWLRPDAPTSEDQLFCHVYGHGDRKTDQFMPGWPYSFVAALESGRTSWVALLDADRLGPEDDATAVTAAQLRDVVEPLMQAGHWQPGDPEILIVMDSGYDVAYLSHALADLPTVMVGRLRSDRVMLRDPDPARSGPKGGPATPARRCPHPRQARHLAPPRRHHHNGHHPLRQGRGDGLGPDTPTAHPPRPWLEHVEEELPILHGMLVRLRVERLPGDLDPKPVWLWCSATGATPADVDRWWQSFLRRFDLEHAFRLISRRSAGRARRSAARTPPTCGPGWSSPPTPSSASPGRWPRTSAAPGRSRPSPADSPPPAFAGGFATSARRQRLAGGRTETVRPGPGRPPGSKNKQRAKRHDVGKTVKSAESIKEHQARRD